MRGSAARRSCGVFTGVAVVAVVAIAGCGPQLGHYKPPADLPSSELASIKLDQRIKEATIEGKLAPADDTGAPAREFAIESGCLALTVKFEESFFVWGEDKAARKGLGRALGPSLANTEIHDYSTNEPIRFFVSAEPGRKYWVTASFTGDEFLPRVVELDPSGDATAQIQPEVPCGGKAPPANPTSRLERE